MVKFNANPAATVGLPPKQAVKRGAVFRSIPRSGKLKANVGDDGTPIFTCPNTVILPPEAIQAIERNAQEIWFPLQGDLKLQGVNWVMNTMADADDYGAGLRLLQQTLGQSKVPVFNHPTEVLKTRRNLAPELFGGIKGLNVPKCTAFEPKHPDDFQAHFEAESYEYPVLVRPGGSQTGRDLIRVTDAQGWDLVHTIQWANTPIFMTQYVDFRGQNGLYKKVRVMLTGGRYNLRSVIQSENWEVRGDNAIAGDDGMVMLPEEEALGWQSLVRIALEMAGRVNLDFFGMDLGVVDDDNFVFFEATAAMTSTRWSTMPDDKQKRYAPLLKAFNRNVLKSLADKGIPVSVPL